MRPATPKRWGAAFGAFVVVVVAAMILLPGASPNNPVTGAAFTTTNSNADGTGHCMNGNENVNCNIYEGKQYVWLNGGPKTAYVGDGDYFFAVLEPGGQADPNDAGDKNLSDDFDAYTDRTFSVSGATVSYSGPHEFESNKIRLAEYADTSNPGGVYIMAICSLADGYPVNASDCKYDAFKIKAGEVEHGLPLTITKDAEASNTNTFTWGISKDADKTLVQQIGGSVTFTYTVEVTHGDGEIGAVKVEGTIRVFNPNEDASHNTVPVDIDGVTDQLSDNTVCDVTPSGPQTLTEFETDFSYKCGLSALPQAQLDNTANVGWGEQFVDNGALLDAGSADFTFSDISFTEDAVDDCVGVTDSYAGSLGTACVGGDNPKSFSYQRTIAVPAHGCLSYDNKATFTTDDTGATGSADETVTVCGPANTGARTIGFWKTTNGQNLVGTYCVKGTYYLGTYLQGLGAGAGPFNSAPTSCSSLKTYVFNVLKGASATNMNNMLKAQMLGTALDVWFSGPGWRSTKIGSVKPPSIFFSHNSLGTFNMDTTAVCPMVDNLSTGTATCKNSTPSTDAVAAGAVPTSPMAMQAILDFASTIDPSTPPWDVGAYHGANVWYYNTTTSTQDRTKQEILKNIFDQFNNGDAFGSF